MRCPYCKENIRVTANPITGGSGRLRSPTARRSVSLKKNPAKKIGYRAKFGRKSAEFFAQNDQAAERYCNGLLAHKMGGKCSSLQRNGKRPPKT